MAWTSDGGAGMEVAEVAVTARRLRAAGAALGADPVPYRLEYRLESRAGFATARMRVVTRGAGWRRALDLRRDPEGRWSAALAARGHPPLPALTVEPLDGADDVDLAGSPITNTLPVLRHGMLAGGAPVELTTAWISVPDLCVRRDGQRYVPLGGQRVRYEALDGSFTAVIVFDADGLVLDYPGIARRVPAAG